MLCARFPAEPEKPGSLSEICWYWESVWNLEFGALFFCDMWYAESLSRNLKAAINFQISFLYHCAPIKSQKKLNSFNVSLKLIGALSLFLIELNLLLKYYILVIALGNIRPLNPFDP